MRSSESPDCVQEPDVVPLIAGSSRCAREQLRQADDAVHRRADLVAHVGHELALGAAGGFGRVLRLLQRQPRPACAASRRARSPAPTSPGSNGASGASPARSSRGRPSAVIEIELEGEARVRAQRARRPSRARAARCSGTATKSARWRPITSWRSRPSSRSPARLIEVIAPVASQVPMKSPASSKSSSYCRCSAASRSARQADHAACDVDALPQDDAPSRAPRKPARPARRRRRRCGETSTNWRPRATRTSSGERSRMLERARYARVAAGVVLHQRDAGHLDRRCR